MHWKHVERKQLILWSGCIVMLLTILIVGCGEGTSTASTDSAAMPARMSKNSDAPNSASSSGGVQAKGQQPTSKQLQNPASYAGPQYLIKTLKVGLSVPDTRKAADEIQTWISTTDTKSTSTGITYDQISNDAYNISMTFSVQASLYPQIQQYLRDYTLQRKGHLANFNETVQDATNDYIDTQSQLKNLRGEQTRLLDLLSHAQALGDILSIEQKLTDVEGQIESIESHLNALNNQLTYYTVTITLQPLSTVQPQPTKPAWNIGQVFHDAFAASVSFAQGLATFLIWLLAFSLYLIPLLVAAWLVLRWRKRTQTSTSATSTQA